MALVAHAIEAFALRRRFTDIFHDLDSTVRRDTARMLEQPIVLRLLGGEAISDMSIFSDEAPRALFDWDEVAHGATFSTRLKRFDWQHNLCLQKVLGDLYRRLTANGFSPSTRRLTRFSENRRAPGEDTTHTSPAGCPTIRCWRPIRMPAL